MSATTFGHRGVEAVQNKDWEAAIPLLDKALESSNAPSWLLARAQAHQQLKNYDAALRDAELAYHAAAERGSGNSRKQMIEAQYRRSVVYHKLERYADADCCAKWSMLLAEGRPVGEDDGVQKKVDENGNYIVTYEDGVADHKGQPGQPAQGTSNSNRVLGLMNSQSAGTAKTGFESDWKRAYTWRSQVLGRLKSLPEDHPGWKINVTKVPPKPQAKPQKTPDPEPESASDGEEEKPAKPVGPAPGSVPDEQLKLRADFYQSNQNVSVSLFVKDVKKEDLSVKFFKNKVEMSPLPRAAAPYVKPGDREATSTFTLGGDIDPLKSRWSVTPRKVELVLQKATPGVKWATWGSEEIGRVASEDAGDQPSATPLAETAENKTAPTASAAAPPPTATGAPAYPTSSRSGPKNWDKLGDTEGDDDPQDVNYFFKQLYKGATPEQQRAMMKSFIESNGTALSTDWEDVKNRKVETVPPEGVEAKKWEA
ncbi:SGS domain-containing protein [Achaetomium macrosporum]|uniref:SGS domain-containing protein n=1 Tax=Achaetomium macrosporum TaxID=79813 RepID=A0AAN7H3S6_9PEZI|nr:SGS domain-containing protein [Achaetomium macrosporum]